MLVRCDFDSDVRVCRVGIQTDNKKINCLNCQRKNILISVRYRRKIVCVTSFNPQSKYQSNLVLPF